ncbi:MAG: long-chain fatty acid--CoA ligase [Pseudomonadota bacterium]
MLGQMQHHPLRIIDILTFSAEAFHSQGITSVMEDGRRTRHTYPELLARTGRLANALDRLNLQQGDRIATLAWNTHRHFELYYAVSGTGRICHTINPRLSAEQLVFIFNHAEDRAVFVDPSLVPLVAELRTRLSTLDHVVVMGGRADLPSDARDLLCYEDLLSAAPSDYDWPDLPEESAAALCYTSGTTGAPKGALYSQRATVLHALMVVAGHPQSLRNGRAVLPVVPMFHVNAWGLPFTAPLAGMDIVMPGRSLDGASLYTLIEQEHVFTAWGVPTVWAGLLQEIRSRGGPPGELGDLVIGGAAAPRSLIAAYEEMGINVNQAWGMTEMTPVGSRGLLPPEVRSASLDTRVDAQIGAGRRLFGVDFKLVDENGNRVAHDGQTPGELYVRGNTIISGYYKNPEATARAMDKEGWFGTGDVATIDATGRLIVRDRAKDLVKSGGEWISSIDLENTAAGHPGVRACAVIAVPHPKWDERPVLVIVPEGDARVTLDEMHRHLSDRFARWQLPDDILFVDALPMTATGKVSKLTLRQTFADFVLPDLREE